MWDRVTEMLRGADGDLPRFPPTVLYNENWMLRLVLDWLVQHRTSSLIPVAAGSSWYSEALLSSAFLARSRGDPLAESYTHADGAVGHFEIGGSGKGDLILTPNASQLTVLEGKMFSRLSKGVRNAPYFDQAARNVACIAHVLRESRMSPGEFDLLRFHVVAPESQISSGIFMDLVTRESIARKVQRRVSEYEGDRDEWFEQWFLPTLERVTVSMISWEAIIAEVCSVDPGWGDRLLDFYRSCLKFNASAARFSVDGA